MARRPALKPFARGCSRLTCQHLLDAFPSFFNIVWEREEIPEHWRKGLKVQIPKKGDISVCDNSRGKIYCQSSKVFFRVILNHIRMAMNQRIREEQAWFRAGRGCSDHIFALRNIVERTLFC